MAKLPRRAAARQAVSVLIVTELFALWQKALPLISGIFGLAEAIGTILNFVR